MLSTGIGVIGIVFMAFYGFKMLGVQACEGEDKGGTEDEKCFHFYVG